MMHIIADLHTHTNVSAHAHSSLEEMVQGAKRAGFPPLQLQTMARQWKMAHTSGIMRI